MTTDDARPPTSPAAPAPTRAPVDGVDGATALGRIAEHADRPLLLDLDLTLVLRPTTEAFLDTVRPGSLAVIVLSVLDKVRPWRWLPGRDANRDWLRVLAVSLLLPWSLARWRRSAASWAAQYENTALADAARGHGGPVVVVTRGFDAVVDPVVRALGFERPVRCRLWRWGGERQVSKTAMLARSPQRELVARAVVVTDSMDDADLLAAADLPVLAEWPGAAWIDPLASAYVPIRYVRRTKPPIGRWPTYAWYRGDLVVTLLGYAAWRVGYLAHAVGLVLLSFALWVLYEAGYHENDVRGAKYEADPVLPPNFDEVAGTVPRVEPWIWAAALSAAAAVAFHLAGPAPSIAGHRLSTGFGPLFLRGFAVVAFVRVLFGFFNRLPKPHRVLPHLVLQIGKYLGFALVTGVTPAGAAVLGAQVVYRWVPYAMYRWHRSKTFTERAEPLRLAAFVVGGVIALAVDHSWPSVGLFVLGLGYYAKTAR